MLVVEVVVVVTEGAKEGEEGRHSPLRDKGEGEEEEKEIPFCA